MKTLLIWVATAIFFSGVGALCAWRIIESGEHAEEEPHAIANELAEQVEKPPISLDQEGRVIVAFDLEGQARAGVTTSPLMPAVHEPEMVGYGSLMEDPAYSFTLRAPLAGKLLAGSAGRWPSLGQAVQAGTVLGTLEPRLTPVEQVDVSSRLTTARGDVEAAKATLVALRTSYETKRALNAQQGIVSDEVLQEAEARVKAEEARLTAAEETVRLLQNALSTATRPAEGLSLAVPIEGTVVELSTHSGESVEAGQTMLRVMRADRFLARVGMPVGQHLETPAGATRLVVAGHEDRLLTGESPVLAEAAEDAVGGQAFLIAVAARGLSLQPGLPVTAYLRCAGAPAHGVIVPRSAVIRYSGRAWAYVRTADDEFTRREIAAETPMEEGWFVSEGFQPQEPVVVRGAQSLLSRELEAQATGGEEEEE